MNNRNDILAELQELSLVLLGIKSAEQKPVVPEGYFDQFSDTVLSQLKEEPQVTILSGLDKNQSIGIPAQYFESFADTVMQKIQQQETEIGHGRMIPIKRAGIIYLKRFAFAASLAGIILLGFRLFNKTNQQAADCSETLACLTQDEIRQYVNDNIDEFEPEQIQEAFQTPIETAGMENTILPQDENNIQTIDENQIDQYIKENPATADFEDESLDIF